MYGEQYDSLLFARGVARWCIKYQYVLIGASVKIYAVLLLFFRLSVCGIRGRISPPAMIGYASTVPLTGSGGWWWWGWGWAHREAHDDYAIEESVQEATRASRAVIELITGRQCSDFPAVPLDQSDKSLDHGRTSNGFLLAIGDYCNVLYVRHGKCG